MPEGVVTSMVQRLRSLPADERGVTSILSLVAVLVFTMLLVMLTNVVRHVDDKVRLQNAADAAALSGGVLLARGMNAVALANHLQAEALALTAFSRALDAQGDGAPAQVGPLLRLILGTPETIDPDARDHLLSEFQRDVVATLPGLAQEATLEIALRHGLRRGIVPGDTGLVRSAPRDIAGPRGPLWGVLWGDAASQPAVAVSQSDQSDPTVRTLPVVDPNSDGDDFLDALSALDAQALAADARRRIAEEALQTWLQQHELSSGFNPRLPPAAREELETLLGAEYPRTNLPFLLREQLSSAMAPGRSPNADYAFVATVHQPFDREHGPRLFRNPLQQHSDAAAYAQVQLILPRPRFRCCPWLLSGDTGETANTDPWPTAWDSFNQTWTPQLVPANAASVLRILQAPVPAPAAGVRAWRLDNLLPTEFDRLSTH